MRFGWWIWIRCVDSAFQSPQRILGPTLSDLGSAQLNAGVIDASTGVGHLFLEALQAIQPGLFFVRGEDDRFFRLVHRPAGVIQFLLLGRLGRGLGLRPFFGFPLGCKPAGVGVNP